MTRDCISGGSWIWTNGAMTPPFPAEPARTVRESHGFALIMALVRPGLHLHGSQMEGGITMAIHHPYQNMHFLPPCDHFALGESDTALILQASPRTASHLLKVCRFIPSSAASEFSVARGWKRSHVEHHMRGNIGS